MAHCELRVGLLEGGDAQDQVVGGEQVHLTALTRDLVLGITPFEEPNAELAVAIERAGGLGIVDLGHDGKLARDSPGRCRPVAARPLVIRGPGTRRLPDRCSRTARRGRHCRTRVRLAMVDR